jgi:hypothetical protein
MMQRKISNIVCGKICKNFLLLLDRAEDDGGRAEWDQDRLSGRQEPGIRLQPHQRHSRAHQEYAAHVSASFLVQNSSVVDPDPDGSAALILIGWIRIRIQEDKMATKIEKT